MTLAEAGAREIPMFNRVLVLDRGLLGRRVRRTLKRLGIGAITVHSEADRYAAHATSAERSVCIGATESESYSNGGAVLDAARITGAEAIHPGQGPLSRSAAFAEATESAGVVFLGPTPEQLRQVSNRTITELVRSVGLSVAPPGARTRHSRQIAIELFGNGQGEVWALGASDLSVVQKDLVFFGEAPPPGLDLALRQELLGSALALARQVRYRSIGSVEFLVDADRREHFFLRFRPYLHREHALVEALTGIDLVESMLRLGVGASTLPRPAPDLSGSAMLAQVWAVDSSRDFQPAEGLLVELDLPDPIGADTAYQPGDSLGSGSEPHLATLTVQASERDRALSQLRINLDRIRVGGVETNLPMLRQALREPMLVAGQLSTGLLDAVRTLASRIEVVSPGPLSILVDYPGRLGYWAVGIPPSGPMDSLAHQLANRCVGNPESSATLEMTLAGATLKFGAELWLALTGAEMPAQLDGTPVPRYQPIRVQAGQVLSIGAAHGSGCRSYLAVRGGFDAPPYLGSRSTFTLGGIGGHAGRSLRRSDVLRVGDDPPIAEPTSIPDQLIPAYRRSWEIGVLVGPHSSPDFLTDRDVQMLFETAWEVHFNSNRTGVRLLGPKPAWARPDGGEAGLHPSNIHDVPYAVGSIDFTGDMPILLGPDGPSLGGFVCPATVVAGELWKLGQLRAGDRVRFIPITQENATLLEQNQARGIATLEPAAAVRCEPAPHEGAILREHAESPDRVSVVYRRAGDKNLLIEYGPPVLDLRLRFRVHALMGWLEAAKIPGILDLTPGIRSLQVHHDTERISAAYLLEVLAAAERELPPVERMVVPTRTLHLPLSWDDPATRLAIAKYLQSVRADAPWCPSNIEFIRRINGLESSEAVRRIVFEASYLVLGLGDVYLGAPVATPIDPRHRLVTTKYNPARTWTPENAVGIGGAYLCIYGMEGPGGYQLVGRTLQVFNRFRKTRDFKEGQPWLLRFFDQIRFYEVGAEQLLELRAAFVHGAHELQVEQSEFRLADYLTFLSENQAAIARFKAGQQAAFNAERQRWVESGQLGGDAPGRITDPIGSSNLVSGSQEAARAPA